MLILCVRLFDLVKINFELSNRWYCDQNPSRRHFFSANTGHACPFWGFTKKSRKHAHVLFDEESKTGHGFEIRHRQQKNVTYAQCLTGKQSSRNTKQWFLEKLSKCLSHQVRLNKTNQFWVQLPILWQKHYQRKTKRRKLAKEARFEVKKNKNKPYVVFNEESKTSQGFKTRHRQQKCWRTPSV